MKSLLASALFLCLVITATSQYNTQLIDSTKLWSIAHQQCPGCGGEFYSFFIKLQGDTTISSSYYTKILRSYDEYMTEWELYGFIREEENKYYLRNLAGEEGLAYDFNVSIGDTVEINNPLCLIPVQASVTNIDSVLIEPENEFRKRIKLNDFNFYGEEYWIDGIGSLAGITESSSDLSMMTGGDNFTLLCYYKNEELLYKMNTTILCFYPIVDIPSVHQTEMNISIYPNPVTNISYLYLDNPNAEKLIIHIYNSTGSLLNEYQIDSPTKINIHSSAYPKGIYFYQLIQEDHQIFNSKFIVH